MQIYLDHHTLARPSDAVVAEMSAYFREKWAAVLVPPTAAEVALKKIYTALAAPESLHFLLTSGGFEAHRQFLLSFYLEEVRLSGKNHFLASCIDEAPILRSLSSLEELECAVKLLPVDHNGQLELDALETALKAKTSLLTLSWANPLTGVIQPIDEILKICHAKGVKVHLNASHTLGTIGIDWDLVDFLSFDGDKIGTPQGIGGLFQKTKPRESLQNMAALTGLSIAVEERRLSLEMARLRDAFERELKIAIPDAEILFQQGDRLPQISAVAFPGVMAEALLYYLNRRRVFASIGGGQYQKLSTQLLSCGLKKELCHSAVSFALSHETTEDQLAEALDVIISSVRKLKTLSLHL